MNLICNPFLINLLYFFYCVLSFHSIGVLANISTEKLVFNSLGPHTHRVKGLQPTFQPSLPYVQANAYLLIDAYSGKILAARNIHEKVAPASLTKMMTSYLISSALHTNRITLEEKVFISEKAGKTGGSRMFIAPGSKVSIKDLLQGVIVQSGNDASIALAEHLTGSESAFANIMNQEAKRLGMHGTYFHNVNGLPHSKHYTTALDMATLARAITLDFPNDYAWYSQKLFTYSKITQANRNRLLWRDSRVDGIKTGDTDEAGYCLAASAKQENMRLIAIIMGAPSEAARLKGAQTLFNYGFRFFETCKIYSANELIATPRVWFGHKSSLDIRLDHDLYVTILRGYAKNLEKSLTVLNPIKAPVTPQQKLGELKITLQGDVVAITALTTKEKIIKGAWWRRAWDYVLFFLSNKWY